VLGERGIPRGFDQPPRVGRRSQAGEIVTPTASAFSPSPTSQVDDAFCCLGTTQATAGSSEAFRHIECDPRIGARLAKTCGAEQLVIITAIGADPRSPIFYSKIKGEVEAAVAAEGLASTSILRPSLLLGERDESAGRDWSP
jgi:hypothetical protein